MGPRLVSRGKDETLFALIYELDKLQWGRDLLVAERSFGIFPDHFRQ